jgi:hypothetical protein
MPRKLLDEKTAVFSLSLNGDSMSPTPIARILATGLAVFASAAGSAQAAPPPEGRCPSMSGAPGATTTADAVPTPVREGMLLRYDDVLALRSLLPSEIWRHREQFFYEGMQLTIGPCHRRYPVPAFVSDATEAFAGRVVLDSDGNLEHYVAGTPFPPEAMQPDDEDLGAKWAWNLQMRFRGAGPIGKFRLVDMPGDIGSVQTFTGSYFFLQTGHRADLAASDYQHPADGDSDFIAGGRFDEPMEARHLAWKQARPKKAREKYRKSDNTFVYIPTMRKMRRAPTSWVDGMYTPRYRVGGDTGGGSMALTGGEYTITGTISPTAGLSIATAEHIPQGFSDLAIRPNAYVWRVEGEREVLAPINSGRSGYPIEENRNFGPSGLSVATDRWDVRWAVVIQGLARNPGAGVDAITIYVDYQTSLPLYVITRRRNGRLVEIGIPVHRFSGDTFDYPRWSTEQPAYVFDPVAAVFYNAATGGSGWRREAYDTRSVPISASETMKLISSDFLLRGR